MLGTAAVAVDYGSWLLTRGSLQNDADAASLAGVVQLGSSGPCGSTSARASCGLEDAWQALKSSLKLTLADPVALGKANTSEAAPYVEAGYRIWVDTPPSAAGTAYPANGRFASETGAI